MDVIHDCLPIQAASFLGSSSVAPCTSTRSSQLASDECRAHDSSLTIQMLPATCNAASGLGEGLKNIVVGKTGKNTLSMLLQ